MDISSRSGSNWISWGPGVAGSPGIPAEYKEYMFLCKKDYGFFKSGNYITMLLNSHLFGALHLKSKDSSMNFSISKNQTG